MHRANGELDVIERILGLEKEIKDYNRKHFQTEMQESERQRVENIGG